MAQKHTKGSFQEESELSKLTVKVIQAKNIPWADWTNNADCYVCLWLPTSTNKMFQTKTISNTSEPKWNESFNFKISEKLQNKLYVTLHDEDVISKNDLLYTIVVDVGKLPFGKPKRETFSLHPKGKEILEMEFSLLKLSAHPEKIRTNGVLVCREVSCLDIFVEKQKLPENVQGKNIIFTVEDSCEKMHKMTLNSTTDPTNPYKCNFHCIRKWEPELIAHIESKNKEDIDGLTHVPFKSLSFEREEKVEVPAPNVHTKRCCFTLPLHWNKAKSLELKLKASHCTEKLDMRLGFDLCEEEKIFLKKRSKIVAASLRKSLELDHDLQETEIPVIAVSTTGGGARAMASLYGTLSGLKKMDLLDTVSYITGASGSTWCMSKLYGDPDWSQKDLTGPIQNARKKLTTSKLPAFSLSRMAFYHDEMKNREDMGYKTSVTDLWGLAIESMFCSELKGATLSDQRKTINNGQNPLPLYLAMNVKITDRTTLDYKEWCEFSPYEVGLIKYGAFIRSEDFCSEFFMGRLIKKLPESRLCYLQDEEDVVNLRERKRDPASHLILPEGKLGSTVKDILTKRPLDGDHHNFLRGLHIHRDYVNQDEFNSFHDTNKHQCPNYLTPFSDSLCLVDSAYYINASFPPLLRKERKVDVILSFDYGLSRRFNSVEQTQSYCRQQKIPFPIIEPSEEDQKNPKECYVFSDHDCPDAPIILHFPLTLDTFKEFKAPGVKRSPQELDEGNVNLSGLWSPYRLLNLTYGENDFDKLVKLAEYNVMNNKELILQAVRDAMARKQKMRNTGAV
uniref:Phospholipase A2 n=1 Tax=Leptobrachium leishanense TaxID=445787 RepID=A0A8C5R271_9ANUR